MESATVSVGHAEEHDHHGPPEANESSRIDKQVLGILLFIVSEVMLFGAFFASYFFLRVVVDPPAWPPEPYELPVAVAGINTAILVSSSFTIHYALESIRRNNRTGLKLGLVLTWILGATFLFFELFWLTVYAGMAAKARQWLHEPGRATAFNRITGAVFLLAAGLLANDRRPVA